MQEIVAAHGGQVAVQSVEHQGTTFIMTLPRAPAAVLVQAEPSQHADHSAPE